MSTTYTNISCTSNECSGLTSATGHTPRCISSTCAYAIQYGNKSFTVGFFGKEKLTITSEDIIDDFYFGCGQNNQGLFHGAAGLLGLGHDKLSFVSQTANRYGKTVNVPKIGVLWGGNTYVDVPISGIFFVEGISQVCLAFAANDYDSDVGIWGNTQQKTQAIVYDVGAGKIGFSSGGCA
ncbi:hypothetical protein L1987_42469 [Smallanthus sonchifolius]|uniref:Uncharacterized protein n=1 Tax=Smallanthus sonchifolius TaxID=185202 RepID=A0ACB9GIQ3_9ASTR|nr:hypothetical protein L1987_42469 [Smallanthus sonchifolius]